MRISLRTSSLAFNCNIQLLPDQSDLVSTSLDFYGIQRIRMNERAVSTDYTYGGLQFTWFQNSVTVTGADSISRVFRIFELDPNKTPVNTSWIKPNHTYYLKVSRTNNDAAIFQVRSYIDDVTVDLYKFTESGEFTLHRVSEINYLYIQVYVPANSTVNNTLTYELYDNLPLSNIIERLNSTSPSPSPGTSGNEPVKIRIIDNNIGCFRFGRTPSNLQLTEEQYQTKLANYKKFLGDLKPDIVCLQEYVKYIGDNKYEAKSVLFDPIFRNTNITSSISYPTKTRAIFTNLECTFTTGSTYATGDGLSTTSSWIEAILSLRDTHVISIALHPSSGSSTYPNFRYSQLNGMMTAMNSFTNVIICADLNVDTDEELTSMLNLATSYGYHSACNGDYWGRYNTYIDIGDQETLPSYYRKIDNILVKGNIKMINGQSLFDESTDFPSDFVWDPAEDVTVDKSKTMRANSIYNKLASDHVPVMADLWIY